MFTKIWRLLKKYYFKFIRTHGSSRETALAVAIGAFIGCAIPMGIWAQTIIAILLAIRLKLNPGLTYAATWVSNPYTVIVMYPVFCFVGSKFIGADMTFEHIKESIMGLFGNFSLSELLNVSSHLALSYFVGALIFGIVFGTLGYYITYIVIENYRKRKESRLARKQKRVIKWRVRQKDYEG